LLSHESLDVYRVSMEFVKWSDALCRSLGTAQRAARDQLQRASQAIPLNIAEGNGKPRGPDRRKFIDIARGSALECGATLDVLTARGSVDEDRTAEGKELLDRISAMLTRLGASAGRSPGEA